MTVTKNVTVSNSTIYVPNITVNNNVTEKEVQTTTKIIQANRYLSGKITKISNSGLVTVKFNNTI